MIITNLIVEKIEKDHPRYPNPDPRIAFSEVYRCEITFANGDQREVSLFVKQGEDMTPEFASRMLMLFSRAVERQTEPA